LLLHFLLIVSCDIKT